MARENMATPSKHFVLANLNQHLRPQATHGKKDGHSTQHARTPTTFHPAPPSRFFFPPSTTGKKESLHFI